MTLKDIDELRALKYSGFHDRYISALINAAPALLAAAEQIETLRAERDAANQGAAKLQADLEATKDGSLLRDFQSRIIELEALLAAAEQQQWQPIETAPKDGTIIDVWLGNAAQSDINFYCADGSRRSPSWRWQRCMFRPCTGLRIAVYAEPTHWMPLPQPPSASSSS